MMSGLQFLTRHCPPLFNTIDVNYRNTESIRLPLCYADIVSWIGNGYGLFKEYYRRDREDTSISVVYRGRLYTPTFVLL